MIRTVRNSVLLFFIDGLGIGDRTDSNPLASVSDPAPLAHFRGEMPAVPYSGRSVPTDPRLGVEGRPQSASGQTTILTGVNAPALLGAHKQGFPNEALRRVLTEKSVFVQLAARGVSEAVFANAYSPPFFEHRQRWKSATTVALEAAGIPFRRLPDIIGRRALYHDFTNEALVARGYDVPLFGPKDAAGILAGLAEHYRFVLYEHFLTDKIGHDQDFGRAADHLPKLAEFVRETVALTDPERTTVILTSDHGNIEDLSVRNHTLNDVPTVVWGRERDRTAESIRSLTDIAPAILRLLTD